MRLHREMSEGELLAEGVDPEEADGLSRRRIGRTARWAEESREAWGWSWLDSLGQDLRFGVRQLAKSPAFTITALASLGIGIGAVTAVFTIVNSLLLKSLPGRDPSHLVSIYTSDYSGPALGASSYPDYLDFRAQATSLADLAAYSFRPIVVSSGERTEQVLGEVVSANYFDLLGVRAEYGRTFLTEEGETPGAHPVVVLSQALWKTRFGSDASIVGKTLRLNGKPFDVIGIAEEGFGGMLRGVSIELWTPAAMAPQLFNADTFLTRRQSRGVFLIGRLRADAELEQAQEELRIIASGLHQAYGGAWTDIREQPRRVTVLPERESRLMPQARGMVLSFLSLLAAIAVLVLLTACLNVSNLLLIRTSERTREIAVRLSLGAGRRRVARQLISETILLFLLAGGLGSTIAFGAIRALSAFQPPLPLKVDLGLEFNYRVFAFSLGLSCLAGLVFGLTPAAKALKANLRGALISGGLGGGRRSFARNAFVVSQVAFSTVLLITAGLLLRSLGNAESIDVGFDPENVVTAAIDLEPMGYGEAEGRRFLDEVHQRLNASPLIESVGSAHALPLGLGGGRTSVSIQDYAEGPGEDMEQHHSYVGPGYFETMRIPLVLGRSFTERDSPGAFGAVVVNEAFARRYLLGRNPIGARMAGGRAGTEAPGEYPLEIVGVAKDGKYLTLGEEPRPYVYFAQRQRYRGGMTLVVRSRGALEQTASLLRAEIRALDKDLPISLNTMTEYMSVSLLPARIAASVAGALGAAALLLATLGLYGVTAYSVRQRMRELGLRAAIGAQSSHLIRLIVGRGMALTAGGLALGAGAAFGVTRFGEFLLYGISPTDPITFLGIAVVLTAAGLAACVIPARRAGKADPMQVLRYE